MPVTDRLPLLSSAVRNLKRFALPDSKEWSLFNPSICESGRGEYAISFRSSNYVILESGELHVTNGGKIRNQVWFADTDSSLTLSNLRRIHVPSALIDTTRGLEDPKLFWRDDRWHFTATLMETHTPVARMAVCRLNAEATEVTDITVYAGLEVKRPEKNWMVPTLMNSGSFDFVYGPNAIVFGRRIIFTMTTDSRFTGLRGGSHLLQMEDGTYLAVMHHLWSRRISTWNPNTFVAMTGKDKDYAHCLVQFDSYGKVVAMSDSFQFVGRGIEFAAGLAEVGNNFVISFGRADVSSHLSIVPKEVVLGMLHPVQR